MLLGVGEDFLVVQVRRVQLCEELQVDQLSRCVFYFLLRAQDLFSDVQQLVVLRQVYLHQRLAHHLYGVLVLVVVSEVPQELSLQLFSGHGLREVFELEGVVAGKRGSGQVPAEDLSLVLGPQEEKHDEQTDDRGVDAYDPGAKRARLRVLLAEHLHLDTAALVLQVQLLLRAVAFTLDLLPQTLAVEPVRVVDQLTHRLVRAVAQRRVEVVRLVAFLVYSIECGVGGHGLADWMSGWY